MNLLVHSSLNAGSQVAVNFDGVRQVDIVVDGEPIMQTGSLILTAGSRVVIENDGVNLTVKIVAMGSDA